MKKFSIDRRLFTILMIVFVQMLGASMILPILPLYAQREFGLTPQTITLLVSVFFAAQFRAGPTIGRLSDKHGRLPILIISQIGTAVSFVMLAMAQGPFMLFAARTLDGITGGNIIVAQAYITDIMPREKRTQALGYIFAAFGLGFIFGPALGGILSAAYGPQVPFLIAAAAAIFTVGLTWVTLDETLTPEQREANRTYKKGGLAPARESAFERGPRENVVLSGPKVASRRSILEAGLVGDCSLIKSRSCFSSSGSCLSWPQFT
jgi:DHA1 family tetracycline resistance protein-like MFS transporter